jgi:RNA polymerase sigma-70 factor (ECF subfamily)
MVETSFSLLDRLSGPSDPDAWRQLVELYTPLLSSWMARYRIQPADADDLVQEVLLAVSREMPRFRHSRQPGAFRGWLRTILVHRLRNYWRKQRRPDAAPGAVQQQLDQLEDAASHLSHVWNRDHDQQVLNRLLAMIQPRFAPDTWQAFHRVVIEGAAAETVAAELNISLNAVYIAKSRVLSQLRGEAAGLVD